ncbi:methyltransferase family protein [Kibdelosporangium aridum]|uniref:Dimerisation domain-containing protein n=1 Tax=Kibdelosporangium aridum TaxID=2030 RepID=A0A1W2CKL5_KIBAR|nr:methyltransferase dimerization domain-containing protein [Kibdelosporangium aridum]SMC85168.1 Dimerisation domain-containing protein [Kibdelosporangium aridum]
MPDEEATEFGGEPITTPRTVRKAPAHRLLGLMTGAWQTQALAVAASLRIFDHLADSESTEDLAEKVGAHPDSLLRLLRYLASLGVLRASGGGYALTSLGELLRTDAQYSLHPLALLYGGSFYESFGSLEHAVRTGQDAFEHVFGAHHFDYFAARPELGFTRVSRGFAISEAMYGWNSRVQVVC